ncbi:MAG: ribosome maturation factor RimM [Chloroflexota bacterium]
MSAEDDDWILVGRLVGAFGIRGEVKTEPQTDFPERFAVEERICLGRDHRPFDIDSSRPHGKQIVLKLRGIDAPEAVKLWVDCDVTVPGARAFSLPTGHYYYGDLIGIEVSSEDGQRLGHVTDVLRTGSNDVYVVGQGQREVLIPGIKDAVVDLDLKNRRLTVARWVLAQND